MASWTVNRVTGVILHVLADVCLGGFCGEEYCLIHYGTEHLNTESSESVDRVVQYDGSILVQMKAE